MRKESFLVKLKKELNPLPEDEKSEVILDFEEHIDIGIKEGRSQEDVIHELGDPKTIAKELIADFRLAHAEKDHSLLNIMRALLATVSLSFFNVIIVLGPALGILGIFLGLGVASIALASSPIIYIFLLIFQAQTNVVLDFFISMTLGSIGILLFIGLWHLGKRLYSWILRYLKYNLMVIKGE